MKKNKTSESIKKLYQQYSDIGRVGDDIEPRTFEKIKDESDIKEVSLQDKLIAKGELKAPEPVTEPIERKKDEKDLAQSTTKQYTRRKGRQLVQKTVELRESDVLLLLNHFENDLAGQSWSAGMRIVINYYIKQYNLR